MTLQITSTKDIKVNNGTYLLYGAPGTGKTTTVKFFHGKTLVLDIDRTTRVLKDCSGIDIVYVDNKSTWSSWQDIVVELTKNYKNKYDNIVVDNISELERCLLSDLGSQGKNKGVPSQADYQYMQFKLVNSLRYLKVLNCNIVWLAWEVDDLFTTDTGQQFNRSYPQVSKKIMNNIAGLCDIVGRLVVKSDGERGFVLAPTNSIFAKNQIDDRKGCLQNEILKQGDVSESVQSPQLSKEISE